MGFGDDEDILQDFLVEAGEILERLSQQLVDLEQRPDDTNLLNAIFRGFHTVKGGAGFLQLNPMVECCHLTENLFDILRNGKRTVTSELMDVVLQALDAVNLQFELVSQHEELPPVDPELIAALERLVSCEDLAEQAPARESGSAQSATPAQTNSASAQGDITDEECEQFLDAITEPSPPASAVSTDSSDDEFEALLDQLHGKGKAPGESSPAVKTSVAAVQTPAAASSDEITDDEFEALLDQLHGKGKAPLGSTESLAAERASTVKQPPVAAAQTTSDSITDDEFENLLDQLHGKGKAPTKSVSNPSAEAAPATSVAKPAVAKPTDKPLAKAEPKTAAAVERDAAPAAETTVRVDTQRLDDIMNMVGELVLVRNRLVRLGSGSQDEALVKAVSNLDVVTADLQTSVMKTRMQPIKKVFGRFPRVVRDLARNLKKEISLDLVGEVTDLD